MTFRYCIVYGKVNVKDYKDTALTLTLSLTILCDATPNVRTSEDEEQNQNKMFADRECV